MKHIIKTSVEEVVALVNSGDRVFIQGAAMTPTTLIEGLTQRYNELKDVELLQMHTEGDAPYTQAPYNESFKINSFFVGGNVRSAINSTQGYYTPIFLGEIHFLFRKGIMPIDVAMIQVSPPDKHGYCSMGTSVDITLPAVLTAKKIIAQINPNVPRTHGDGIVHIDRIDAAIMTDNHLFYTHTSELSEIEESIGKYAAELVEDGATLQMGIGNIPNAVLSNLYDHKRLGIHTEMFSDGILPLVERGVITGEEKEIKTGKIVTCFAVGSQKLYDFVDDNPLVHFKEAGYTNDTAIIRQNPKVTAINSAIEIDLTGQVCADTIGTRQYSGVGGQMDFIRGASLSEGGKPIFAMPARTRKGTTKIVPRLNYGAGITTTRAHVHHVVTEYGRVDLFGKSLKERAQLLISIAHPEDRAALEESAYELYKIM